MIPLTILAEGRKENHGEQQKKYIFYRMSKGNWDEKEGAARGDGLGGNEWNGCPLSSVPKTVCVPRGNGKHQMLTHHMKAISCN